MILQNQNENGKKIKSNLILYKTNKSNVYLFFLILVNFTWLNNWQLYY